MDRLPRDLWVQIFLRLPVKTILQCLSVCKSWQLYIQHPSFINSHLQHHRRDLMLVRSITKDNGEKIHHDDKGTTLAEKENSELYSLYCDDDSFSVYAKHEFLIHHPGGGHYRVVGICNGIICLTNDEFSITHETYLWNPTIRKCVELPCPVFTYEKIGPFDHELGFGFDEKTNDYKVIRIVQSDDYDEFDDPLAVEIYSLSSNIWRKASHLVSDLDFQIFQRYGSGRNFQVYFNGALHWVCVKWNSERSRCMVVAFHLGDEVFRCFDPPLDIKHDFRGMRNLRPIVFQGLLSLIQYMKPKCSIWMMKDYGDSTSWAKYLDVNLSNHVDRVLGLRKKGEFLIEIHGGLYSCEPTEGKELMYLDERDLWYWKLLQKGHMHEMYFSQRVLDYDPEYAPKELGIKSETSDESYSFYTESYTESLELLGRMKTAKVAKLIAKESKRIHEEDNKQTRFEAAEENPSLLTSVFVKNLPFDVIAADLEQEFKTFGKIIPDGVFIKNKKEIGVCYAFVEYEGLQAVHNAVKASPLQFSGRQIFVEERRVNSNNGVEEADQEEEEAGILTEGNMVVGALIG